MLKRIKKPIPQNARLKCLPWKRNVVSMEAVSEKFGDGPSVDDEASILWPQNIGAFDSMFALSFMASSIYLN